MVARPAAGKLNAAATAQTFQQRRIFADILSAQQSSKFERSWTKISLVHGGAVVGKPMTTRATMPAKPRIPQWQCERKALNPRGGVLLAALLAFGALFAAAQQPATRAPAVHTVSATQRKPVHANHPSPAQPASPALQPPAAPEPPKPPAWPADDPPSMPTSYGIARAFALMPPIRACCRF